MKPVPVSRTRVEMTQIVLPGQTNNHGTAFGGQIAAWCDITAAVAAQRYARGPVVTASMDQLHFLQPVRQGMVVILAAQVNEVWRTSMEVGVRVDAENIQTGEISHCCSAYLTFVALGPAGRPVPLPPIDIEGSRPNARRQRDAQARRDARLQVRALRKKHRAESDDLA